MIWAIQNSIKVTATPNQTASCPSCNEKVISKCGSIKVWHWAHTIDTDCDSWSEGETEWHKGWKDNFPKEQQEVVIGSHRADIKNSTGKVIELQNSPIASETITAREEFYKNMIWLLNGKTFAKNLWLRGKENYVSFRWKHPPKSWWVANKEIYIDLGEFATKTDLSRLVWQQVRFNYNQMENDQIFQKEFNRLWDKYVAEGFFDYNYKILCIRKIHHNIPCGGWGILLTKQEFLEKFK